MVVGILTFVKTSNYGAALQAYALSRVIAEHGVTCEIIDYDSGAITKMHNPLSVFRRKGIIGKVSAFVVCWIYRKRLQKFQKFSKHYCRFSSGSYDEITLPEIEKKYDRIVVGSDQVWNLDLTKGDKNFFLPFITDTGKKYSYAASLGASCFEDGCRAECEKMLEKFAFISVREATSAKVLEGHISKPVHCDIDPTLLLDRREWQKFIKESPCKKDYILLYLVPDDEKLFEDICKFADEAGCEVFWIKKSFRGKKNIKVLNTLSPEEFLNYIYYADYIIAGSFHAICFSIIFGKNFYYTESSVKARTVRLSDLLKKLDIQDRKFSLENGLKRSNISYEGIDRKLESLREDSQKSVDLICSGAGNTE